MVTPSLRLAFLQGRKTLQYDPGSTIRVGRIVRGNEVVVNDARVSANHLRIRSDSSGDWLIQDLGSSNGTLLNSNALNPHALSILRDGDIIEIGKYTSFAVNFVNDVLEQKLPKSLDISEEAKGLDVIIEDEPSSRVRKVRKIENSENLGVKEGSRVQRNMNLDSCVNSVEVDVEDAKNSKDDTTRSKNIEIAEKSCLGLVNVDKDETVAREAAEEALKEKSVTMTTRSNKSETPNQMSSINLSISTERSFNEESSVNQGGSGFELGSVSSSAFHQNPEEVEELERLKQLLEEKDAKLKEMKKQNSDFREELYGTNTFLLFLRKKFPDSFPPMR